MKMRATWKVAKNANGTVVEVSCERCGRKTSFPMLTSFQHGGPCGVSTEFASEKIREQYAEIKEAGRPRVSPS
jgi:hypothetical protein